MLLTDCEKQHCGDKDTLRFIQHENVYLSQYITHSEVSFASVQGTDYLYILGKNEKKKKD
jgi:hypothetical protein